MHRLKSLPATSIHGPVIAQLLTALGPCRHARCKTGRNRLSKGLPFPTVTFTAIGALSGGSNLQPFSSILSDKLCRLFAKV
jgi:hypothetical protein